MAAPSTRHFVQLLPAAVVRKPLITGTVSAGQVLTCDPNGFAHLSFVWQRADDTNGTNLTTVGSTGSTYTIDATDVNKYIRVGVTHT